jgi:hypothetical protein
MALTRLCVNRGFRTSGRIDIATNGAVSVLGATTTAVLEVTAEIFADQSPTNAEEAVLEISEKVADRPLRNSTRRR